MSAKKKEDNKRLVKNDVRIPQEQKQIIQQLAFNANMEYAIKFREIVTQGLTLVRR